MSKGLKLLNRKPTTSIPVDECYLTTRETVRQVKKELKALDIIKEFVWMEDGEIRIGLYGDAEIPLKEGDFKSKREYDLLKEALG